MDLAASAGDGWDEGGVAARRLRPRGDFQRAGRHRGCDEKLPALRVCQTAVKLAEGVGFEPTLGLLPGLISSQVPSTTQPPFQRRELHYASMRACGKWIHFRGGMAALFRC